MKINICDPGFLNIAGHHYDLNFRVAQRLVEMGHDVHVYAHKSINANTHSLFSTIAPVSPHFSVRPYVTPKSLDLIAGEQLLFQLITENTARELTQLRSADLWLWPTMFAGQLNACTKLRNCPPISACIHSDLGDASGRSQEFWRLAFINVNRSKLRIKIGAKEQELVYAYSRLTLNNDFRLFSVPYDGKPLTTPKTVCQTIGFFGHQRNEKGTNALLGEVVSELLQKEFSVVVQNSGDEMTIPKGAVLKGFIQDFAEEISKTDLIVLPYDSVSYQYKGSGILSEAIATGVPVIVTQGTAPGRIVEKYKNGVLIFKPEKGFILDSIYKVQMDYKLYSQNAFLASKNWRATNSTANFVNEMCDW